MKQTAVLTSPQQAHAVLSSLWAAIKQELNMGHRLTVKVEPEKRSNDANRLLHASIADIAEQLEWAGAKRDAEVWKRLLVAAWCRVKGHAIEVLPAVDGHGVDIVPARTSKLSRGECSDLQEYVYAFGVDKGVKFKEPA